jgi:hypothetical protein
LKELFEKQKIKGLTEKFIRSNSGNIPVYGGGQTESPVGMIADDLDGVKYFENCLAWNREGSVGHVFFHNHKFTTNDHHRPMVLKEKYRGKVDLFYVRRILEQTLLSSDSFEWSKTASKEKVKLIAIDIPIMESGEFDIMAQKKIIERIEKYDKIKEQLNEKVSELCLLQLEF